MLSRAYVELTSLRLALSAAVLAAALAVTAIPLQAANANTIPLLRIRAGEPLQFAKVRGGVCISRLPAIAQSDVSEQAFRRDISAPPFKRIVVFVPGFATSIRLAYSAAARIQSDLGSDDRVVLIDWGSAGRKTAYEHDARTARRNASRLVPALLFLRSAAGKRELDVFAHSLGTRIVALAVPQFKQRDGVVVTNVVLAAPDMTVNDYQRAIVREPGPFRHITLYVSQKDRALLLSEIVHLHRRLGRITHWSKAMAKTDVVDASAASTGPDGHGYAINEADLIRDVGLSLASAPMPHPHWRQDLGSQSPRWIYYPPPGAPKAPNDSCSKRTKAT